eukprot:1695428-Rhodomonas_salina.6
MPLPHISTRRSIRYASTGHRLGARRTSAYLSSGLRSSSLFATRQPGSTIARLSTDILVSAMPVPDILLASVA